MLSRVKFRGNGCLTHRIVDEGEEVLQTFQLFMLPVCLREHVRTYLRDPLDVAACLADTPYQHADVQSVEGLHGEGFFLQGRECWPPM